MSAEENKALVRWWWEEVWAKGNVAAVDEFMAANYVEHPSLPGLPPGPEGMKQALTTYRTGFPDLQATLDDILAEGDRVALRWSARDTHLGDWLGIPPTGQHFTMSGISVFRITEGKAVEGWNSIEVHPTEEEQRWLTEGGGGTSRGKVLRCGVGLQRDDERVEAGAYQHAVGAMRGVWDDGGLRALSGNIPVWATAARTTAILVRKRRAWTCSPNRAQAGFREA